MEDYIIRYANEADITNIKKFINAEWKQNHICVRENGFFEWQYISDKLNYVIAVDSKEQIQGMLGFIAYDDTDMKDIALSMWKSKKEAGIMGLKLFMFIQKNEKYRNIFAIGININTTGFIYKKLGFHVGKMKQWYRLKKCDNYKIASIHDFDIPLCNFEDSPVIKRYNSHSEFCDDFDFEKYVDDNLAPYKSCRYIERRYFSHPVYQYMVFGIKPDGINTTTVLILRIQEYENSRVIRFVDCIGNINRIAYITKFIDELLVKEEAEYIDMYEIGLPENILREAGWKLLDETSNIIPNYFAPYCRSNVDIYYCTQSQNIILFRGDGDQDRPN